MHLLVGRGDGVQAPALLCHHGVQLRMDVAPFAHPARADEAVAQALLLLPVGQLVAVQLGFFLTRVAVHAAARFHPLPELERAHEFRLLVIERLVPLVGGLRVFQRPVTHVLAAERGGDDEHFRQAFAVPCFEDHAAHTRVQRQARELLAGGCQLVCLVHRAQFRQQVVAVGNRLARRWLDKRKVIHCAQVQRLHSQDHAGE